MFTASAIIPCKNEEEHISRSLNALLRQGHHFLKLEIIVVDNGSSDNSVPLVKGIGSGVKLLSSLGNTIAEVRNYGAANSTGEWLAFIDADVEVDERWGEGFAQSIEQFRVQGLDLLRIVTGSTYSIPNESSWIERVWYQQLSSRDRASDRYINGGNLIIHRKLFKEIGGFDPAHVTGEDEKLCFDARNAGARIIKENSIKAIHHGYPKSIWQFLKTHRWHGLAMKNHILRPWRSKDLLLSFYYLCVFVSFLFALLMNIDVIPSLLLSSLCLILPLLGLASLRCVNKPGYALPLTLLYFLYGCARTFCLLELGYKYIRRAN